MNPSGLNQNRSYLKILFSTFIVVLLISSAYLMLSGKGMNFESDENPGFNPIPEEEKLSLNREELEGSLNNVVSPLSSIGPINSLLISQHGDLITEQYYGSMNAARGNNIKSASKSVLSILIGIAIDQGYLESVDQTIEEFFPDYFSRNPDPQKASITIEDLLTMRSGLASTSRANYGRWVTSNNWIEYKLNRPLQGIPGQDRIYSTGNTHLLAVILTKASGMNTLQFANRYLFGPMDIRITGWDRDPQGYFLGGNNMAMRPRDMIKIGRLMMDVGRYNGEQIVSSNWVLQSVEPVTGRISGVDNYGYLWFQRSAGGYHMVYAFGSGGQYIMMLPELDAIISITTRTETAEATRNYRRDLFSTIDREIIPLLEAGFTGV
ncbi:MAG: serine hydrolase [Balneolaceae bacterium]|nr:serine hydrolase [Balneolaceae bacterium]